MPTADDRRSELIAAAVSDDLSAAERAELDALRASDPAIDAEIEGLRSMMQAVARATPAWEEAEPSAALRDRVVRVTAPPQLGVRAPRSARRAQRRRAWVPLLAAACLAVGIGVGAVLPPLLTPTPQGPPGTLGAIEAVEVRESLDEGTVEAEIVAHTWGTEAILDADGLEVGATYDVVLIGTDGTEFSAGAMLGSDVRIHCRVNAAVLREDVVRLEVRGEDAGVVAVADLPTI
ncbi:hypothetical protein [Agrococcus sp. Marseille-P2731]|uniref:hypothetical protein n=1 Tax=Agrococcus sp. Marseille-P2731 TaxID=1841862 RepID=UPI0009316941|nr:hypothetical protein [Agrococcus sp. Marseille-P2731]